MVRKIGRHILYFVIYIKKTLKLNVLFYYAFILLGLSFDTKKKKKKTKKRNHLN